MSFITLDFETYYGDGIGFKTQTNEEYLRDPRFHVIGVGIKVDEAPAVWFSGTHEEIKSFLKLFDWENSAMLAHNALFDGAILAWHFGITPAFYYDTLCMARAIHGVDAGGSLAALTDYYAIGKKGEEVINAYNLTRSDFLPEHLDRYGEYCKNDVELTYKLFQILSTIRPMTDDATQVMAQYKYLGSCGRSSQFPESEYKLIDMTLRMYIQPTLMVDDALLGERLNDIAVEKAETLQALVNVLNVTETDPAQAQEEVRKRLSSNQKFADILKELGVPAPVKPGKNDKNGNPRFIYAFAKTDEAFIALQDHSEPVVQQLCAARLGTKSTMEEARIIRFREIGGRNKGYLPVPLKYYGAHTGRWAGDDKINFQNLPSRDKRKKALKRAVVAPPGHTIINCDSSQIEARVLAWLAGDKDLVTQFQNKEDVYSTFATKIFKRQITKADEVERFVGKTCLGLGSLVLSERGWVPIEQITAEDRVWDGEEWVCHSGVVSNGMKETLPLHGLWLTPDHQVWSGTWQRADYLLQDEDTLCRALGIAAANLPLQATWSAPEDFAPFSYGVTAAMTSTPSTPTTSKILNPHAAHFVRGMRGLKNAIGSTLKRCLTTIIEHDFSIGWLPQLLAVTQRPQITLSTTANVACGFATNGVMTERHFYGTSKHYRGGITRTCKWTESTTTRDMNRGISVSQPALRTCVTAEKWPILKPVFDILNCGSRNRFTVLTERGPLIVHNCILGLGYGTGAQKLQHTLKTQPPGAILDFAECVEIVTLYRDVHRPIKELWATCELALTDIMAWPEDRNAFWLNGLEGAVEVTPEGFRLPNGLYIRYPNLRRAADEYARTAWFYDSRKGMQKLWGGTIVENIVQALARIIVGEQMLAINERYRVNLTVHDAAVNVVPEDQVDEAVKFIVQTMSTPPAWAKGLPVACEATWGPSYGEPIGKLAS